MRTEAMVSSRHTVPIRRGAYPIPYSSVSGLTSSCRLFSQPTLSIDFSKENRFVSRTRDTSTRLRTDSTTSASGLSDLMSARILESCSLLTRSHLLMMTTSCVQEE